MSILFKIAAVAFVYVCLSTVLKPQRPEYVFLIRICVVVIIFLFIVEDIANFITNILSAFSAFNISSAHISLLLKVVGISIVTDFVCDSLKDSGESSLSNVVSISSKFMILYMSLPLLNGLIIFCLQLVK